MKKSVFVSLGIAMAFMAAPAFASTLASSALTSSKSAVNTVEYHDNGQCSMVDFINNRCGDVDQGISGSGDFEQGAG